MKLKTIFLGTPDFSIPTLELLANHPSIELTSIVTMPDRPAGRGQKLASPPVALFAKENKIELMQTKNINQENAFLKKVEKDKIDLIIVLAFAQFLNSKVLAIPQIGCFNIHTSLLPKYRGAAPIQHAIINGDKSTGVSIQKMVKKMDAGDLVYSKQVEIGGKESGGMLYTRLKFLAALGMSDFIEDIINNRIKFTPQDEAQVSFAPTINKKDGLLDFSVNDEENILNMIRGFNPRPGCFFTIKIDKKEKRLKVYEAIKSELNLTPGELNCEYGTLQLGCKKGAVRLTTVQLEGKKTCSDSVFLNGMKNSSLTLT